MTDKPHCSFCGKSAAAVFRLIAGPSCTICSECIGRAASMIAEELKKSTVEEELKKSAGDVLTLRLF